jgi:flagellar hook-associated protein 1 FlgK
MAFYEFGVAVSGLHTARTALQVTTNNVSNAATEGYCRQVTKTRATIPLQSMNGVGMVGTGSEVYDVVQMRSFYLDKKHWDQTSNQGEYETKNEQLDILETIFNELSDVGVTKDLNNLFNSLSDLTTDAIEDSYRTSVITYAETLATDINTIANNLLQQQRNVNEEISAVVSKINTLGKQISSLTKDIYSYEMSAQTQAKELRDQRALLVDELSSYVNIEVKEVDGGTGNDFDKKYYVLINGQQFVNHYDFYTLECVQRETKVDSDDAPGLYDVFWSYNDSLNTKDLSGELGALLQIRDGNSEKIGSTYSYDYIDTAKLTTAQTGDTVTINAGAASTGQYKYRFTAANATSIELKGYVDGDAPNGVSAADSFGNTIYQAGSTGNQTETTLSTIALNSAYQNSDGSYDVTIDINIDEDTATITYTYTDDDGNEKTETETYTIDNMKSLSYVNVKGSDDDLSVKNVTAKVYAEAEVYTSYNGIPYYIDKLNSLAKTVALALNKGEYADGTKIDGVTGHIDAYDADGETGNLFFSYKDDEGVIQKGDIDYDNITALNFSLSQELYDSPKNLAASTTNTQGDVEDENNNRALLGYLSLKDEESLFQEGGIYNYINAVSTKLGIDNQQASKYSEYYGSITLTIDNQRLSVSSVDINEEMTNLVQYQQVYLASSKIINVINEIYDTLINGTFS